MIAKESHTVSPLARAMRREPQWVASGGSSQGCGRSPPRSGRPRSYVGFPIAVRPKDLQGETILTADIDIDDITRAHFDLDVNGHYARPDIFQLVVNEEARKSVISAASATRD